MRQLNHTFFSNDSRTCLNVIAIYIATCCRNNACVHDHVEAQTSTIAIFSKEIARSYPKKEQPSPYMNEKVVYCMTISISMHDLNYKGHADFLCTFGAHINNWHHWGERALYSMYRLCRRSFKVDKFFITVASWNSDTSIISTWDLGNLTQHNSYIQVQFLRKAVSFSQNGVTVLHIKRWTNQCSAIPSKIYIQILFMYIPHYSKIKVNIIMQLKLANLWRMIHAKFLMKANYI